MRLTAHKTIQEPPMSDTRHLADLKFDERPLSRNLQSIQPEGPQTDMMMLQKADVWMSQFKTRLNIGIIALVVLWGTVSYFKSTGLQLAAHSAPETERILADGSLDDPTNITTLEVDSLQRGMTVETVEAVETEEADGKSSAQVDPAKTVEPAAAVAPVVAPAAAVAPAAPAVKAAKPASTPAVRKIGTQKTSAQKAASGKNTNRNQKKLKKSVASKSAP